MPNNFEILAGFLARYGDEVEGRESAPLPADVADQLRRFARGQLAGPAQGEIIQQLGCASRLGRFPCHGSESTAQHWAATGLKALCRHD